MWPMADRVERQASRMHEMMKRLDVNGAKLARLDYAKTYQDARTACLLCARSKECLRWLDEPATADRPSFCPSLALFEACKRDET